MAEFMSIANVLKLGQPDAELANLIGADAPPAHYPEFAAGRKMMWTHDKQAATDMQTDAVIESTDMISMRDGHKNELRIYSPRHAAHKGSPLIVLYFGGGFMFGNNYQCANYATALAQLCNAVVVLPSYRLAPEHPFPTGPNDAWDSFVWVATNGASLGADPSLGFIIGGRSAGGTLAAVIAQKALDEGFRGPPITGTWLSVPMLLTDRCVPPGDRSLWVSREQNQEAPLFNGAMLEVLMEKWKPDELSTLFSPFNTKKGHSGLPTTYLQACGLDPLRDDALLYERALRRDGVSTILDVYPGLPHGVTTPFPYIHASKKYQTDVIIRIGQMLGQELSRVNVEEVFPWPKTAIAFTNS